MKTHLIDDDALRQIINISRRLYTENRMGGDEMRDLAQALDNIARHAIEVPE